ncbi:MAG: YeeE/YedE thiosulfate transporter family protein [Polyangiaceae bacterium]|nr:YeeE/YedE thiosulfate transporter family protein [Polyangiaceae bacterium]
MENFTPLTSLAGGLVIGLASALLLLLNGRIAGVSGIAGGLLRFKRHHMLWRALFVAGLVAGGVVWNAWAPQAFAFKLERSSWALIGAGLLVGFGTQLGDGCTSGHGICGLSRFSPRSLVAVLTFMGAAAITVFVVGRFFGGTL